jgi:hypothetical protein
MYNKYKVNMHTGLSDESNHILGETMETTARKSQKSYSEHVVCSTITNSVYYNIIREEQERKEMTSDEKYIQDMVFMDAMGKYAIDLTKTLLLMRWFLNEIQNHKELLC